MNKQLIQTIFKAVGLALGVATLVLSIMNNLETENAITMLSLAIVCLGITQLNQN